MQINDEKLRNIYLRNLALGVLQGPPVGKASIDKPWLKDYEEKIFDYENPQKNMYQMLVESNKDNMDNIAIDLRTSKNGFKKGITITYRDYIKKIDEFAEHLSALGVEKDEIVLSILPNIPESRISIYGTNKVGAVAYPVLPTLPVNTLRDIIKKNNIKKVFIFSMFYEKYAEVLNSSGVETVIYVDGTESIPWLLNVINPQNIITKLKNIKLELENSNLITWRDFSTLKNDKKVETEYVPNHTAVIVGTSGTTGTPKGVCLTEENLNAIAAQHELCNMYDYGDVCMDALIQSIGYGVSTMHFTSCSGFKNVLIPELLTNLFPKALCVVKPDNYNGGPIHYNILSKSEEFAKGEIPQPKNMVSGGASLSKEVEKKLNNVGPGFVEQGIDKRIRVRQGLGATENGGCGTYAKPGCYKFGGVGIPLPLENMGIFKPGTDEELLYGEEGEICICGPSVMKEYLNNQTETKKVLKKHKDGKIWLHTCDLGYCDCDGQFFITDRIKNIFMRKGFNIHPSKIEEFLLSFSVIEECKILGVDHPTEQCVPIAFIQLNCDYNSNLIEYIKEKCYENLDEFSIPYKFIVVNQIPKNVGGKADEGKLLEILNAEDKSDAIIQDSKTLKHAM